MAFTLLTAKLFSLMWPSLVRKIPGVSPLRFTQMKLILNGNGQQEGLKTRNSVKYFKITFIRIDNIYQILLYWATIIIFDIYIHIRELYLYKWCLWGLWSQSCKIYNHVLGKHFIIHADNQVWIWTYLICGNLNFILHHYICVQ